MSLKHGALATFSVAFVVIATIVDFVGSFRSLLFGSATLSLVFNVAVGVFLFPSVSSASTSLDAAGGIPEDSMSSFRGNAFAVFLLGFFGSLGAVTAALCFLAPFNIVFPPSREPLDAAVDGREEPLVRPSSSDAEEDGSDPTQAAAKSDHGHHARKHILSESPYYSWCCHFLGGAAVGSILAPMLAFHHDAFVAFALTTTVPCSIALGLAVMLHERLVERLPGGRPSPPGGASDEHEEEGERDGHATSASHRGRNSLHFFVVLGRRLLGARLDELSVRYGDSFTRGAIDALVVIKFIAPALFVLVASQQAYNVWIQSVAVGGAMSGGTLTGGGSQQFTDAFVSPFLVSTEMLLSFSSYLVPVLFLMLLGPAISLLASRGGIIVSATALLLAAYITAFVSVVSSIILQQYWESIGPVPAGARSPYGMIPQVALMGVTNGLLIATFTPLFYYGSHDTVRHTVLSLFFLAKALAELLAVGSSSSQTAGGGAAAPPASPPVAPVAPPAPGVSTTVAPPPSSVPVGNDVLLLEMWLVMIALGILAQGALIWHDANVLSEEQERRARDARDREQERQTAHLHSLNRRSGGGGGGGGEPLADGEGRTTAHGSGDTAADTSHPNHRLPLRRTSVARGGATRRSAIRRRESNDLHSLRSFHPALAPPAPPNGATATVPTQQSQS